MKAALILSLIAMLACAGVARADAPTTLASVPAKQSIAQIISEVVVCKQPERYIGWPSVVTADNGDLVAVFSGDRDWHVCPWGKVTLVRSSDGGQTWSAPQVIADTPLDDRDTGITKLPDGSLIASFNTSLAFDNPKVKRYEPYQKHAATLDAATRERWKGVWTIRSTDHGQTWSSPQPAPAATPHGPTALRDGRLMFVRPEVFASADLGKTWSKIAQIVKDEATWKSRYAFLSEQHAVEAADGRIVALARYADKDDIDLRQTESADGGKTWTPPVPTGMRGYPAHLLRLNNGWLLASYGRRIAPLGERACISKDDGRTWLVDQEIILSNAVPQGAGDLGYPCSAQLPDGSIWTVYYQVEKESDGEYPSLMGTHWRLTE
jgi:hypothetical protein